MREKEYLAHWAQRELPKFEPTPVLQLKTFSTKEGYIPGHKPISSDFVTDLFLLWSKSRAEESSEYLKTLHGAFTIISSSKSAR